MEGEYIKVRKDKKVYVDVNADHLKNGTCMPKKIRFSDGKEYLIDDMLLQCRVASGEGGSSVRYTVRIKNRETYLFDEENGRWFVEAN